MAWYYGVNNSDLYGSNFSTVLADAPPPLDDACEEDDNEIVFRSDVGKSKKYNEQAVTSTDKSNEFNDKLKSKLEGSVPNSRKLDHEVAEDDFGDFAVFADFGSAFGPGSTTGGEPQSWFTGEENGVKSFNTENTKEMQRERPCGIKDNDNEYVDFAALQENVNSQGNQKNIPNDESDPRKLDNNWVDKNELKNQSISSNGSYNMESDDDFGDFTSVNDTIASHKVNVTESESTSMRGHSDLEVGVISRGKTCKDDNSESEGVSSSSPRDAVQCNGSIAEKRSVDHPGEPSANQSSKESHFSSPGEITLSEQNGEMEIEESSGMSEIKESDMVEQDDRHSRDSSTCERGTESERLPEKLASNNNSFGEFADFNDHVNDMTIDNDVMEKPAGSEMDKAPVLPPKFVGVGDGALQNKTVPAEDCGDDSDFGDFGSFEENHKNAESDDLRTNSPTNDKDNDDNFGGFGAFQSNDDDVQDNSNDDNFGNFNTTIYPNEKQSSIVEQSVRNDCKDDDSSNPATTDSQKIDDSDKNSFRIFDGFKSNGKDSLKEDNGNDLGNFGVFETNAKDSEKGENDDDFGGFGSFGSNPNESEKGDDDDDFGDFGAFESKVKDYQEDDNDDDFGNFRGSGSIVKDFQKNDTESDFGDFGAFKANTAKSQIDYKTDEFGGAGSSEKNYNFKSSEKSKDNTDDFGDFGENVDDDFGDFGTFESSEKQSGLGQNSLSNNSGDFGTFKSQAEDSLECNKDGDEFGDFGAFESKKKSADGNYSHSEGSNASGATIKEDNTFGDFGTSLSPEFVASSSNSKSKEVNDGSGQTDNNFGDFSGVGDTKTAGFTPFPSATYHSSVSGESSSRKNVDIRQQKTGVLSHFHPGDSVATKHAGDPISVCFPPEERHISAYQCEDLCVKVAKSFQSNLGLWQQLERTEKEGRIILSWANSFSQHKKFLSLSICPERPPPLQVGSMLKPIVSSQLPPYGGRLARAMVMPQPTSKLPQFSSGLSFLEPIKASQDKQAQDKQAVHDVGHAEVGLPDLSFVLGSGLKRTASKSDVKDNVSDTTSESSSLDLDFFAPSIAQPSDGKTESRGLYEEDLLGLDIFSPSVEPRKLESPKPQNKSSVNAKKVWQHGGVTIPLSSQQNKIELSATAKSLLGQLEDLTFMNSSVLMFPLKSD